MTRKKRRKLRDEAGRNSVSNIHFDPSCPICVATRGRNNVEILPGVVATFLTPDDVARFQDLHARCAPGHDSVMEDGTRSRRR